MLVVTCPGQGAQSPGMLTPWTEVEGFTETLGHAGEIVGADLLAHGTTSDADTIRDTAVAQPLLGATALAAAGTAMLGLLVVDWSPDSASGAAVALTPFGAVASCRF